MANAAAVLPDDVATLQAMVLAMQGENRNLAAKADQLRAANDDAEARIARLYAILKMLERARYGRRSEALDEDQQRFVFDEIQTGLAAIEAKLEADPERVRTSTVRKALPAHLERIEEIIEPDPVPCACGSCSRVKIGEDVRERLDVVPSRFRVIVTRRPRYACTACRESIVQAPAPARLIEAGLPTEALLAHVAVSKYADGLPLYRQEAIYARDDVAIGRNVMAGWMGRVGFHLEPLADRILALIRDGDRIFADETTLPTLAPGNGRAKKAWLWTYARDDRPFGRSGPPMVASASKTAAAAHAPNVISRASSGFSSAMATVPTNGWPVRGVPAVSSRSLPAGRTSVASSTSFTSPACATRRPGPSNA